MTKFPDIKRAVVVSAALSFLCLFPFSGLSQGIDPAKDAGVDYQRQKQVTDRFIVPIESYNGFAGTYGELRGDHFHCGLDMRTGGVQGKKIYAADDGYISKITIGPWGYGNRITVTHPSGYKTIYGHLLGFAPKYKRLILEKQYAEESWGQYIDFPADSLPVKRGDLIAFSGNTGSSGGPHLHFEVLDENDVPVNLQLTGIFSLKDSESPAIRDVRLVGCTPFYGTLYTFPLKMAGDTVKVPKAFYAAIDAYDIMAGTPGKLAVYKYEALLDGKPFFCFTEGNIPTSTGRYIASLLDNPLRRSTGRYFIKTQIDPSNKLADRIQAENDGIVSLGDSLVHTLTFIATDVYGNSSRAEIKVRRDDSVYSGAVPFSPDGEFVSWDKECKFFYDGLAVTVPAEALYRNAFLRVRKLKDSYTAQDNVPAMSGLWRVGDGDIPLHKSVSIVIRADIPAQYRSKALVARVSSDGSLSGCGGTLNALTGEMTASIGSFGTFCVTADVTRPEVSVKIAEGAAVKGTSIKCTIRDRLSGIKTYRAEIDGHWVVAALDGKTATLEIPLGDARISKGKKHSLVVCVEDNAGNKTTVTRHFTW
jgi:murein DD-endopeptidase MepM/ murein hydrolase activator NlpD